MPDIPFTFTFSHAVAVLKAMRRSNEHLLRPMGVVDVKTLNTGNAVKCIS
jgi:hypothetical protein